MFLYVINYPPEQQELCQLEIKRLFNQELQEVILSEVDYEASRSVYFKSKLEILVSDIDKLAFVEKTRSIVIDRFKVSYIKHKKDELTYENRMNLVKDVAFLIKGVGSLKDNAKQLGVIFYKGTYYLGIVSKDHQTWQHHQNKPQSYSQSLSARDARTLVNIATGGKDVSIVDPCCGVGTVVLEALEMKHQIDAYEIHKGVTWKANRNLEYFGYPKIIQNKDMHTIDKTYDVAILDIPYNLYSSITKEEQFALLESCHRIANYLVLISYEELDTMLSEASFDILEKCLVKKMKFGRYVYYCERGVL